MPLSSACVLLIDYTDEYVHPCENRLSDYIISAKSVLFQLFGVPGSGAPVVVYSVRC